MTDLPWEDNLLERKTESDLRDLLKTLVAFANSVRPGHTAVILIGEKDDDTVQGVTNPDNIQKTIRNTCDKIYPPILWKSIVYEKEGKYCVRIEIEYDGDTPHFGGIAWVRKGSETIIATDEVFQKLIELRLNKVRELAKWIGKEIVVEPDLGSITISTRRTVAPDAHPRLRARIKATLLEVNNFWMKFIHENRNWSEPLEKIVLSWDDKDDCLKLLLRV